MYRYLDVNRLIPTLQEMTDTGIINIGAVDYIAKLDMDVQNALYQALNETKVKLSAALAKRVRSLADSQNGLVEVSDIIFVLTDKEDKKPTVNTYENIRKKYKVTISDSELNKLAKNCWRNILRVCHHDTLGKENKMNNFDETNENTESTENSGRKKKVCLTASDLFDMGLIFAKIAAIVLVMVGVWFGIEAVFKSFGEQQLYNSKASVSAGVITDKEIINGHTKSGGGIGYYDGKVGYNFNNNKSYVPTVYRIHISAEFEYCIFRSVSRTCTVK